MDATQFDQDTQQKICELLKKAEEQSSSEEGSPDTQQEVMLEKLEKAKANKETIKVSYTTILFTGSSGVGKTTLLNKLNKQQLNRHHHSTGVVESKHTICVKTTAVVKSTEGLQWIDLNYDSMINHLNKHLHSLKFPPPPATSAPEERVPNDMDKQIDNSQIPSQHVSPTSSLTDNISNTTRNEYANEVDDVDTAKADEVAIDIATADSSNTPSLGDVWDIINFLDTGGQPEFVNILPAVSSSIALTFIVFNLSEGLGSLVHVKHNVRGEPSFKPYHLDCTNLEYIKRLMVSSENFNKNITSSLKSIQREEGGNDSKICYIGTHAVGLAAEKIQEIDSQLSSVAKELELQQRSFWSSPKEPLKRLFPVDMFPDDKESFEDIIEDIRDNIQKQVQKRNYYEVPIMWLIFLLRLQKLCNIKNVSYMSYQEAVGVWNEENVSENELGKGLHEDQHESVSRENSDVHNILLFFHFMGMLFYYHKVEGMCDFVFVDRQWLFKKLTELVEIKFRKSYYKKYISAEDVEKFTMEGRLSINIIKNLKIDLQGIEPLHFINLLNHLNIIAPLDTTHTQYFMPCVLPSFTLNKSAERFNELDEFYGNIQHAPLLVGFKSGPMPHGFFCHLIVQLFRHLPKGWHYPLEHTEEMQRVYNNMITFPTVSGHAVSLFYKIRYLEVQVRHEESKPSVIHCNVQCELDKALRKVSDHLQLNKKQLCYGFYCKCKRMQHFAKLEDLTSPADYIYCDYSVYSRTKLSEDHRVWLQVKGSNINTSQQAKVDVNTSQQAKADINTSQQAKADINTSQQTETGKEPNMKWMRKVVIPEVSYCWRTIADYLEYPLAMKKEIEERQRHDPRKCCAELMEDWLTSDRGVGPRTWDKLVSVLKEVGELSSSVTTIEQRLLKEGLLRNENK